MRTPVQRLSRERAGRVKYSTSWLWRRDSPSDARRAIPISLVEDWGSRGRVAMYFAFSSPIINLVRAAVKFCAGGGGRSVRGQSMGTGLRRAASTGAEVLWHSEIQVRSFQSRHYCLLNSEMLPPDASHSIITSWPDHSAGSSANVEGSHHKAQPDPHVRASRDLWRKAGGRLHQGIPDFRGDYTEEEFVENSFTLPLDFQPGEKLSYGNTGCMLPGVMIHRITGKPSESKAADRRVPTHGQSGSAPATVPT